MMKTLASKIVPVLVLLAVAVVGALGPDDVRSVAQAAPGPDQVLIVNPEGNPARTSIVGPVTATIANTPAQAVPVSIEGTPSVAVSGGVSIEGTPNVAVSGAVTVGNTEADPIPVRDVGARTAWVGGGQILIDPGEAFDSEQFFAAPHGQRLVIEAFTIDVSLPLGQIATQATVLASAAGEGQSFRFPLPSVPSPVATRDSFGTVQAMTLNVAGGVIVSVSRNATTGTGLVNVALSGYLVNEN
jgi:hypothetical protein